jgi:alanine racemase
VIRLADLLAADPSARIHGATAAESFDGFAFDSRVVRPGQLFVAFRTDRRDGHAFASHACRGGAAGVLTHTPVDVSEFGATCVVVDDTDEAVRRYAAHAVRTSGVVVVGVGGSVGKTSTKEAVASVLGTRRRVFRNPANLSGRFGLPLALGGLHGDHEVAVLEMASGHFGEVAAMASIAPPSIAVVTSVTPVHMATFGTVDKVAAEYGDLLAALEPDGLAVVNGDDPRVVAMARAWGGRTVTYGREGEPDLRGSDVQVDAEGTSFTITTARGSVAARIPWVGRHFVLAALAALAVGAELGVAPEAALSALAALSRLPGRLRPLPGRKGALLLDDTFNSSPAAVAAALAAVAEVPADHRVAVLGDMEELGEVAELEHRAVGRAAASVLDALVTRGPQAAWIADEARRAGMPAESVTVTHAVDDAVRAVEPALSTGTMVLAKGSTVTRTEHVVARLLADPDRAREVLVRQDAAWRQLVVVEPDRPTWLEIDHSAIAANIRHLRELARPAGLMAVVKADGYGHGAVPVIRTALNNGATWCGVACLSEAEALRRGGVDAPILVLGYTPAWQARHAVRLGVSVTVFDAENGAAFSRAAEEVDGRASVHVKVDTGMHRLGADPQAAMELLETLAGLPRVDVHGLFTHLAVADETSAEALAATDRQLEAFGEVLSAAEAAGLRPPIVHALNSAGLMTRSEARFDLVRVGVALYGLQPSAEVGDETLRPALSWKTQVAQVRPLDPGEAVGYGRIWATDRPSVVATIPVGYADGFRRAPTQWREVLVRGRRAPVVGRISMDQATIDVTEVDGVRQGDEVVLIGDQGGDRISAEQVAGWLGTNAYEVVAEILPRVPRV